MSFQRVRERLEQMALQCQQLGKPCTQIQLHECVGAYGRLQPATGSHPQAMLIFEVLRVEAMQQPAPCSWLARELHFEAYATALGDRSLAAGADLESWQDGRDAALDHYNQRLSRFTS